MTEAMIEENRARDTQASQSEHMRPASRAWPSKLSAVFVWAVWIAMLANSIRFIGEYGSEVMFADDLSLVDVDLNPRGLTWDYLWTLHNEHRVPLAKLIQYTLYVVTGDVRSGCYFQVALLAATAAACVLVARRLRGSFAIWDAFFPLLWMHTGNAENLLLGFQISLVLGTAITCALLLIAATRVQGFTPATAIAASLGLIALPLCGGPGMVQVPLIGSWLSIVAWNLRKSTREVDRRTRVILWSGVLTTIVVVAIYVQGFDSRTVDTHNDPLARRFEHGARVFAHAFGPIGGDWWPWPGWYALFLVGSATFLGLRAWRKPTERMYALGLLFCLWANVGIAVGIAVGRSPLPGPIGFALRYIGLTSPSLVVAYLCWLAFCRSPWRALVHGSLCAFFATALFVSSYPTGEGYGDVRHNAALGLLRDMEAGARPKRVFETYRWWIDGAGDVIRLSGLFRRLACARHAPFDKLPESVRETFTYPMFDVTPSAYSGTSEFDSGTVEPGKMGLLARQGTLLTFRVPPGTTKFRGAYAAPTNPPVPHEPGPVRFIVTRRKGDVPENVLDRTLNPERNAEDHGVHTFEFDVPPGGGGVFLLRVARAQEPVSTWTWGWWSDVRFE